MSKWTRVLPSSRTLLFATCFLSVTNFLNLRYTQDTRQPPQDEALDVTLRRGIVLPDTSTPKPVTHLMDPSSYQIFPEMIYFYSAFIDRRFNHHKVRFLGIQHERASDKLFCHFTTKQNNSRAIAFSENFLIFGAWPSPQLRFMARMYACPLPDGLLPLAVDVSLDSSPHRTSLPLLSVGGVDNNRQDLALCVKGVWGSLGVERLVEWIEFNRVLGVQKIIFYDVLLTGKAVKVVEYYAESGFLAIQRFDFARKMSVLFDDDPMQKRLRSENLTHEQSYLVSMNDCYYAQRDHFKYVMILDVDEVIIPARSSESLVDVIKAANIEFTTASAFNFHTAWHLGEYGASSSPSGADDPLFMQRNLYRSEITRSQPKAIIATDRAITVNWHGSVTVPSRRSLLGNVFLPWKRYGYVHHFRAKCKHAPGKCQEILRTRVSDDVIPEYKSRLSKAVKDVLRDLTLKGRI